MFVLQTGDGRRALIFDEHAPLSLEDLDVAVALDDHRRRYQDEDRGAKPPIAVQHRETIEKMDLAFGGVRRGRR
jgi:hypothetical protein